MSKKNIVYIVVAIIVFLLALFFCIYFNVIKKDNVSYDIDYNEVSKTTDIENTRYNDIVLSKTDGTSLNMEELDGFPVVLYFFSTENEESMEDLKKISKMYEKYKNVIKFLPVNTAQEVNNDLEGEYSLSIYYDFYKETARNYNITNYPSFVFINKNKEVFQSKTGFMTDDALEANLDILSENF